MTWQILKSKCLESKKGKLQKDYPNATDKALSELALGKSRKPIFGAKHENGETVYSEAYRDLLINLKLVRDED